MKKARIRSNIISLLALLFVVGLTFVVLALLASVRSLLPDIFAIICSIGGELALLVSGWIPLQYRVMLAIFVAVVGSIFGAMGSLWFSGSLNSLLIIASVGILSGGIAIVILGWRYGRDPSRWSLGTLAVTGGLVIASALGYWLSGDGTLRQLQAVPNADVIAVSPDGKTVVAWNYHSNLEVRKTNIWAGQFATNVQPQILPYPSHNTIEISMAFSPDGKTLASISDNSAVDLWDAQTWTLRHSLPGMVDSFGQPSDEVVAFSADSSTIAQASWNNGTVNLWDVRTGTLLKSLDTKTYTLSTMTFSPDGKFLATNSDNDSVNLWDLEKGRLLHSVDDGMVTSLAFSPDGTTLASATLDYSLKIWNVETGTLRYTFPGLGSVLAQQVAFSPDGTTLASTSWNGTVKLWNVQTGVLSRTLSGAPLSYLTFSPDGKNLMSRMYTTIGIWNVEATPIVDYALLVGGLLLLVGAAITTVSRRSVPVGVR